MACTSSSTRACTTSQVSGYESFPLSLISTIPQSANTIFVATADFLDVHPGGAKILKRVAGRDATKQFWKYHGKNVLEKHGAKLKVGELTEMAKL